MNPFIAKIDAENAAKADWLRMQKELLPSVRNIADYRERTTIGLVAAAKRLTEVDSPVFDSDLIKEVHFYGFGETLRTAGQFREPGKLAAFGGEIGAEPSRIPIEIERMNAEVAELFAASKTSSDDCVVLAYTHARFIAIHPFVDGNGRVGRELMSRQAEMMGMNMDMDKLAENRSGYIAGLKEALTNNDLKPLAMQIAQCCDVPMYCTSDKLLSRDKIRCRPMMQIGDIKPLAVEREMVMRSDVMPLPSQLEAAETVIDAPLPSAGRSAREYFGGIGCDDGDALPVETGRGSSALIA